MKRIAVVFFIFLIFSSNQAIPANFSIQTAHVLASSMKYVRGFEKNTQTLVVGIVYDPASQSSKKEADDFRDALHRTSQKEKVVLSAKLVPINKLNAQSNLHIVYVTQGLHKHFGNIYKTSKQKHLFTVSNDIKCVQGKCCILAIKSASGTEIYLNEVTMRELGYDVDAAFKFMVKRS